MAVKAQSVESVARLGDRREILRALLVRLCADLDVAPPTVSAQLASQIRETCRELDQLPVSEGVSVVEDLAARRQARRATAAASGGAGRGGVVGGE